MNTKPKLRGISHLIAFFCSLVAGPYLLFQIPSARHSALLASGVYALSLALLFGISALYHIPTWGAAARQRMRRLDHSAIFLLIAGTATPLAVIALETARGKWFLALTWIGAGVGILKTLFWIRAPKWVTALIAVGAGFLAIPFFPTLHSAIGGRNSVFILAGGLIYVVGAAVYAFKRPNPFPRFFGYHEIFHALVIAAAALHYATVLSIVSGVTPARI